MKDRPDLDYANSEKRDPEWTDLIVEMFNDADVELRTRVVKDLHENFVESIDCPKGSYILSIDKTKDLLGKEIKRPRPNIALNLKKNCLRP